MKEKSSIKYCPQSYKLFSSFNEWGENTDNFKMYFTYFTRSTFLVLLYAPERVHFFFFFNLVTFGEKASGTDAISFQVCNLDHVPTGEMSFIYNQDVAKVTCTVQSI